MHTRLAALLGCFMIVVAGCSSSTTTGPGGGSPDGGGGGNSVVGKWVPQEGGMPEGSYMEFTADGKITMNMNLKGNMQSMPIGTYKVEGDKMHLSKKDGKGKDDNETNTIKSVTAEEMVLVDPKGKEEKFKRVK